MPIPRLELRQVSKTYRSGGQSTEVLHGVWLIAGAVEHELPRRMVLLEAGFIGLLDALLGLALGFVLSLLLIYVVNQQSFGWTIQFHLPVELLAGALLLIWCATAAAGFYPARAASRLNPIEVIHGE